MNELLQKHGCANVFKLPEGLKELMADISREVLRAQPPNICEFIQNYLSVLLMTREHGILAVRILDDLCDCQPSVSEHLLEVGVDEEDIEFMSQIIQEGIALTEPAEGKERLRETAILKKILKKTPLDEDMTAKVCQVIRNAYRDFWYRKRVLQKHLQQEPDEPWEIAAQHTLDLYKKTKPSLTELTRAAERIQAAYKGYHIRKDLLHHLRPKMKIKHGPEVELPGPPLDIAGSREIDLGPLVQIDIKEDDVNAMFDDETRLQLGLNYDPMKTITHVEDEEILTEVKLASGTSSRHSRVSEHVPAKSKGRISHDTEVHRRSIVASKSSLRNESVDLHKRISFATVPPIVIEDSEKPVALDEKAELETVRDEVTPPNSEAAPIIDEAIAEGDATHDENIDNEAAEVPEDITATETDDEGQSVTATEPTTGDVSELEDVPDDLTGEDQN